jgi:hypothetical protein
LNKDASYHNSTSNYKYKIGKIFDGFVTIIGVVSLLSGGGNGMTALRAARALRIFRLAKRWTSFQLLLKSMYRALLQLGNFGFLLFLMVTYLLLITKFKFLLTFLLK